MSQLENKSPLEVSENVYELSTTNSLEVLLKNLTAKITELEQRLATQTLELELLRHKVNTPQSKKIDSTSTQSVTTSRRRILKKLGVAAAGVAVGLSTITAATPQVTQAADNDFALLGNTNLTANTTYFSQSSGSDEISSCV